MSAVPDRVLNWLYSALINEYRDVNRTYSDVAETLSHFPSLKPRTEVFTYDNGTSALLLLLAGTVPVMFRGTVYRFPLAVWVPHAYPHESPIVFVTPTQDMLVRPGQHVAADGRVYHPYLAQWAKYWDKSSVLDFLAVLRGVFSKEPPVRSAQQGYSPPQPAPQPPPVPPPPEEWRRSQLPSQETSPSPAQVRQPPQPPQPPPKPPKPHEATASPGPQQEPQQPSVPLPPPLPPLPPDAAARYANTHGSGNQPLQPQFHAHPGDFGGQHGAAPIPPHPSATHQVQPPLEARNRGFDFPQGVPIGTGYVGAGAAPQPRPGPPPPPPEQSQVPQFSYSQQFQTYPPPYQPPPSTLQPPRESIPDLLSSPLDVTLPSQDPANAPPPAPPIPPNPEKDALLKAISQSLINQLRKAVEEHAAALPALNAQNAALRQAHARLEGEMRALRALDEDLASNERALHQSIHSADRVIAEAARMERPDVDAVLVAPTVVASQLYSLVAEERAAAETAFVLAKALDRGRLSCDVFVRQTRAIHRDAFLKKALIKKIARGIGLEEGR